MVSEVSRELQEQVEAPEEPEGGPVEAEPEGEPADETEPEPSEEEQPDPLAEVIERLGRVEQDRVTRADLQPIQSAIGRVPGLQSALDELSKQNPTAAIDPRLSANESLLTAVATALLGADAEFVPETSKASLRSALGELDAARTQRDREAMKNELLSEIQQVAPESTETVEPTTQDEALVQAKSLQLQGYAEAKGVEYESIPQEAMRFRAGETIDAAFDRVKAAIDELSPESTSAERVATRRQAAGSGTPARSGGATSDEDLLTRLEGDGIPMTDDAARKRAAKALGVELPN